MPQTAEEKNERIRSGPQATFTSWWNKFHFSGRVIMCSVLFGLGLVLIGSLIFAINMNDDDSKPKKDDMSNILPTKPPSNYVGPVVMGIGGFIVVVGVIMCLFETQVCRKKTGDASPLISRKNDDSETKSSDPTAIPSTSHSHKNQSHKCRSGYKSKKSKGRHGKVHSHEHDSEKFSSSQSPPVSMDKPKSFITSSEEKFLTPPSTLEHGSSQNAEIQTSSSLMKSFTSSGPSWSQSAEFLTPSTSFRDNSVSLENSIEIHEKHDQVNFKTNQLTGEEYVNPAFMSPLTIEEDKIQQLFDRVKNEKMEKEETNEKQPTADMNFAFKRENTDSSVDILKDSKVVTEMEENEENIIVTPKDLGVPILSDTPPLREVCNPNAEFQSEELIEKENDGKEQPNSAAKTDVNADDSSSKKAEEVNDQSNINIEADQENSAFSVPNREESLPEKDSVVTPLTEVKKDANLNPECEALSSKTIENDKQADLESSISSDETIVSQDFASSEEPKNLDSNNIESSVKEYPCNDSKIHSAPEPLKDDKNYSSTPSHNTLNNDLEGEAKTKDLIHQENDKKDEENTEHSS